MREVLPSAHVLAHYTARNITRVKEAAARFRLHYGPWGRVRRFKNTVIWAYRWRMQAALTVYKPGAEGFDDCAKSFSQTAKRQREE